MHFEFVQVASLPVLAWCARLEKGEPGVTVYHGTHVEVRSGAFVEGAWDGDFSAFDFMEAAVMNGTGGKVDENAVRFRGSSDRLDPLFSVDTPQAIYVSNSFLFPISAAGEEPDPIYPYYSYDLVRIWRQGQHNLHGIFPLRSGRKLGLHFGAILQWTPEGGMTVESGGRPETVPDHFQRYRSVLIEKMKAVLVNAGDAERRIRYHSLAAISRGYDSSATCVLARDAGCRNAVTLFDSREPNPSLDSGTDNARRLGMECLEVDRWEYLDADPATIAALSLFAMSCDSPMVGFEDALRHAIIVSGHFGDTIWDPVRAAVCGEMSQTWSRQASGISMLEYRLRVGFLSFAPAAIMARNHLSIHAITHDAAMRPWHVPGSYNRPMARRIIEDAGVPRSEIAAKKRGGGHANFNADSKYRYPAVDHYRDFVARLHEGISPSRQAAWRARVNLDFQLWRILGVNKKRLVASTPLRRRFPFFLNSPPIKIGWPSMFTFQWAYALLSPHYCLPAQTQLDHVAARG